MIISEEEYLMHYGILRESGRYPWGSGENQNARNKHFLDHVEGLRKQGLSETEIANGLGVTTTQLRASKSIARNEQKQADIGMAQRLKNKGYSNVAIGTRMGINESSVRALLDPGQKDKADILKTTADMLRQQVDTKGFIDIGSGVENHLGISATKLKTAVAILEEDGYKVIPVQVDQVGGGNNKTLVKVLAPPNTTYKDVVSNKDAIRQINEKSPDGGRSYLPLQPPVSINSKRVAIKYAEDGGKDADGVIYVRPGVDDVSLGGSRYAQVRIAVDGTHFIKGMAIYKDDLPDGIDVQFNTNKSNTGNKLDALKPMKNDPDNPFGSSISAQMIDPKTGKVTSVMNRVNEEGSWDGWSKNLSSQFLSKQAPSLAKSQLNMTYERKKQELDDILALTNPTIKKKLLEAYADGADSSAVHLKAAALPKTSNHVILPITTMKDTEIYAPNYNQGERVVLVRHPHGGKFEIPELVVNNNHPEAKLILGDAKDAVGISARTASKLSGADFDGDTVLVIPNNHGKVKTEPTLTRLKDFDPQAEYPKYEGMPVMSARTKQIQMGEVSNLITDMTIRGANNDELARAIRHSMVVIDAEKHKLNYKQSAIDNGIKQLKTKYQSTPGKKSLGASTLISRASSEQRVPDRKPRAARDGGPVDPTTGKRVYTPTGEGYVDAKGKWVPRTIKSTKLAEAEDAHALSSGTPIEKIYADHSNSLKSLGNLARKEALQTKSIPYSPSAKVAYSTEVNSLNAKLNVALMNRPRERQAQVLANTIISAKRQADPNMEPDDLKKIKYQALAEARYRTGADKTHVKIEPREWEAIQAGAISNNKLSAILDNADLDQVKKLATPKTDILMTPAKQSRATTMLASGYTRAEVAEALGVSVTTLKRSEDGGE